MMKMEINHFKDGDFQRCVPPCHIDDMEDVLLERLEYARILSGFPFVLTSAYRTSAYELNKGRSGTSSHTKGLAVDIHCQDEEKRFIMVQNLLRAGFTRIGIDKMYVHADCDYSKKGCIWLY